MLNNFTPHQRCIYLKNNQRKLQRNLFLWASLFTEALILAFFELLFGSLSRWIMCVLLYERVERCPSLPPAHPTLCKNCDFELELLLPNLHNLRRGNPRLGLVYYFWPLNNGFKATHRSAEMAQGAWLSCMEDTKLTHTIILQFWKLCGASVCADSGGGSLTLKQDSELNELTLGLRFF